MTIATYSAYDAVTVRRVLFPQSASRQPDPSYRMTISPVDQPTQVLYIPYAPVEVTHTRGAAYADVNRPGKKPALIYLNEQRKEMSMTLMVADKYQAVAGSPVAPVQIASADVIARTLNQWANAGYRLRVTYGSFENTNWRITGITTSSKRRTQTADNNFTLAEMSLTFTEVQDAVVGTGPVSGGVKPAPSKTTPAPKTRTYTVKHGDTLWAISIKYYGTGKNWRKIADANKIKDPDKIRVGQKLKIP